MNRLEFILKQSFLRVELLLFWYQYFIFFHPKIFFEKLKGLVEKKYWEINMQKVIAENEGEKRI